jgi:hypothetical protein
MPEALLFYLGFVYCILSQLRDKKHLCQTISGFPGRMPHRLLKREKLGFEPMINVMQAKRLLGGRSLRLGVQISEIKDFISEVSEILYLRCFV